MTKDRETVGLTPEQRVVWAMWNGKLESEGLGTRAGRNGSREAETMPYDDNVHAPLACFHGVSPYACGECTGTDHYRVSMTERAYRLARGDE